MSQITILLATYNGAKFIESQLLSIIGQTFRDWILFVHDDGSTDNTLDILAKWAKIDSRIHIIEDKISFGNAAENFMHLSKLASSDYVMFCDQDDVWFENKIQWMYDLIKNKDQCIPQLVYSSAYLWTDYIIPGDKLPLFFAKKLNDFLFLNCGINGCFGLFNLKTLDLLQQQNNQQAMHDHILQLIVLCFGEISYIKEPFMLYRRHNETVTNGKTHSKLLEKVTQNKEVPVIDKNHYNVILQFYESYKDSLSKDKLEILTAYLKMKDQSFFGRIKSVFKYKFNIGGSVISLVAKMIVRPFFN